MTFCIYTTNNCSENLTESTDTQNIETQVFIEKELGFSVDFQHMGKDLKIMTEVNDFLSNLEPDGLEYLISMAVKEYCKRIGKDSAVTI